MAIGERKEIEAVRVLHRPEKNSSSKRPIHWQARRAVGASVTLYT